MRSNAENKEITLEQEGGAEELTAAAVLAHVKKLLYDGKAPVLTDDLAQLPGMQDVHQYLVELRKHLNCYARGDYSEAMKQRGVVAGAVKGIQASTRHLIWQMEQVAQGIFNQRIDFMGDFSSAFNGMVKQLDDALSSLRRKEEELLLLTNELKGEVEKRGAALCALQKSEENFKYLSEHDPLTNLLNRRSFFSQAELELARNTIMERASCLAIMDIDHFKHFNDSHGHLTGDTTLRHVAAISGDQLRDNDIMGRLGGEEFVFFFSNADLEKGMLAAERIRTVIDTNPVEFEGLKLPVTASFGVVCIPPGFSCVGDSLDVALRQADKALYEAKSNGRNQVRAGTMTDIDVS